MPQTPITIQMGNMKVYQYLSGASFAVQVHGGHITPSVGAEMGSWTRQDQERGIETTKDPRRACDTFWNSSSAGAACSSLASDMKNSPFLGRDLDVPMLI